METDKPDSLAEAMAQAPPLFRLRPAGHLPRQTAPDGGVWVTFVFEVVSEDGQTLVHPTEDGERPVIVYAAPILESRRPVAIPKPSIYLPGNGVKH